mmetsp:Transcript_81231/g.230099  ORF Transcript_81231/g.230099 Transcript_81231/m.230099 type:complete len:254 (-) Transcript_81231:4-765(-)
MGKAKRGSLPAAVMVSKQLSQILRHSGRGEGLDVRPDGYALLEDVLRLPSIAKFNPSHEDIRAIVETNDKQRFTLQEEEGAGGRLLIRANQGHSMEGIDMDELCGSPVSELNPGEVCCHGTYEHCLQSILKDGLKAGGKHGQSFRRNVHFSIRPPGEAVVSGMRLNSQVAIYVDLPRAARDGIPFYRSANDVILTVGIDGVVPPEYFESVWHIQRRVRLHPPAEAQPQLLGEHSFAVLAYQRYRRVLSCCPVL